MSEEEIIKGITNIIYTCNEIIEDTDWYDEEEIKSAEEQSKLTQSLLDLYKQEKEKNKKLQIRCKELIEEKQELNTALLYDNIHKDKIRAILEKYKYTEIVDTTKIIEFYKAIQNLLEEN